MAFVGTLLDIILSAMVIIYKYPMIIDNYCYFSFRMLALMWSPRHIRKIHTLPGGTGHPLPCQNTRPSLQCIHAACKSPHGPFTSESAAAVGSFPTQCAVWPLKSKIKYAYAKWLYTSLSSDLNQNSYTPFLHFQCGIIISMFDTIEWQAGMMESGSERRNGVVLQYCSTTPFLRFLKLECMALYSQ